MQRRQQMAYAVLPNSVKVFAGRRVITVYARQAIGGSRGVKEVYVVMWRETRIREWRL